ncbi:thiol peroxidase [Peptoniphilus equinus]|uniref:Thiol peroxidase n=1 Tax=Peptoniphilus equinus TaxID=3016343 RepID=A0ABY7QTC2_9FIRM|nr:thiol peroxidase [Peptoniphilus equinus]WBW50027.1 thiol peroxidase [Peptoniphilus equinus]
MVKFNGNPVTLVKEPVKVGDMAPSFKATNPDLSEFHSEDVKGKVVVYSIAPSIDTGVCQLQAKEFNQRATELSDDVVVYTVTVDLPFAQSRFCAAEGIENAKIISDYKDREFGEKFGFLIKELGLLARGVVVVDKEGKITYVEVVDEVTHAVDFDAAVEAVKQLS